MIHHIFLFADVSQKVARGRSERCSEVFLDSIIHKLQYLAFISYAVCE